MRTWKCEHDSYHPFGEEPCNDECCGCCKREGGLLI